MNEENQSLNPELTTPQPAAPAAPAPVAPATPVAPAASVAPVAPVAPAAPAAPAAPVAPAAPAAPVVPVAPMAASVAPAAPNPPKKHSLLWLWILLGVLAVAGIIAAIFLFAGHRGGYKSNPSSYLAASADKTISSVSESFADSPFAALRSSLKGLDSFSANVHFDVTLPQSDDSVSFTLQQKMDIEKAMAQGDAAFASYDQDLAFQYYMDKENLAFNIGDTGWVGFSLKNIEDQIQNSIFASGKDNRFEFDYAIEEELILIGEQVPALFEMIQGQESNIDYNKLFLSLAEVLPQPSFEDVAYTFGDNKEKDYKSYVYHLTADDIKALFAAFLDLLAENTADKATLEEIDTLKAALDDEDLDLPDDFDLKVTVAFHQDHIAAVSAAYEDFALDILLGEDPYVPENFSVLMTDGDEISVAITRERSEEKSVKDAFAFEITNLETDEVTSGSIGTKWEKKSGDLSLFCELKPVGLFPIQVSLDGNLEVKDRQKGFALALDSLTMQALTETESYPFSFTLSGEPGADITPITDYTDLFSMDEDDFSDFLMKVYISTSAVS